MGSEEDSIEEAAIARKERLKALKAAQELMNTPDEGSGRVDDPANDENDNGKEKRGRRRRKRRKRTDSIVDEPKPRTRQKFDRVSCLGIDSETCTRRSRSVTQEEKERTIRSADMYKPNTPFFKVILRPSYVYRGFLLHIPNSFAQKYLTSFSEFIKLEVSGGKRWSVRCVCGNGKAKLCKGWTEFVWGNKLEEGDVCVFEIINVKDVLKVTIFRVLEEEAATNI